MRAARWFAVVALVVGATACGDEDETSGTVTPEPPETSEAPTEDQAAAEEAGPVVDDPTFELRADAVGPYASGELGQFAITLTPRGEYHVNEEYPIRVELEAPGELGLSKTELAREDTAEFGEERARFDVPFTPTGAGEHRVSAKVDFAVCTPENCIPDERTLALVLPVQ